MDPLRTSHAKKLRKSQTEAEKKFWSLVRSKQLGTKFRRQQPIGNYIVDFICLEKKLIVELDGSQHLDSKEHDNKRDHWLRTHGFTIMRFWDNEFLQNPQGVLEIIWQHCTGSTTLPLPPPLKGGEVKTTFQGTVIHGQGRGKELGFPTANLKIVPSPEGGGLGRGDEAQPLQKLGGIYLAYTIIQRKKYPSLFFIGKAKTFGETQLSFESYILDFDQNLYGKKVIVELLEKIRENKKFRSVAALVRQIRQDEEIARRYFEI